MSDIEIEPEEDFSATESPTARPVTDMNDRMEVDGQDGLQHQQSPVVVSRRNAEYQPMEVDIDDNEVEDAADDDYVVDDEDDDIEIEDEDYDYDFERELDLELDEIEQSENEDPTGEDDSSRRATKHGDVKTLLSEKADLTTEDWIAMGHDVSAVPNAILKFEWSHLIPSDRYDKYDHILKEKRMKHFSYLFFVRMVPTEARLFEKSLHDRELTKEGAERVVLIQNNLIYNTMLKSIPDHRSTLSKFVTWLMRLGFGHDSVSILDCKDPFDAGISVNPKEQETINRIQECNLMWTPAVHYSFSRFLREMYSKTPTTAATICNRMCRFMTFLYRHTILSPERKTALKCITSMYKEIRGACTLRSPRVAAVPAYLPCYLVLIHDKINVAKRMNGPLLAEQGLFLDLPTWQQIIKSVCEEIPICLQKIDALKSDVPARRKAIVWLEKLLLALQAPFTGPVRPQFFAQLTLSTLYKQGDVWICLPDRQSKSHRAFPVHLLAMLTPVMDRWMELRKEICAEGVLSVYVNSKGRPASPAWISKAFEEVYGSYVDSRMKGRALRRNIPSLIMNAPLEGPYSNLPDLRQDTCFLLGNTPGVFNGHYWVIEAGCPLHKIVQYFQHKLITKEVFEFFVEKTSKMSTQPAADSVASEEMKLAQAELEKLVDSGKELWTITSKRFSSDKKSFHYRVWIRGTTFGQQLWIQDVEAMKLFPQACASFEHRFYVQRLPLLIPQATATPRVNEDIVVPANDALNDDASLVSMTCPIAELKHSSLRQRLGGDWEAVFASSIDAGLLDSVAIRNLPLVHFLEADTLALSMSSTESAKSQLVGINRNRLIPVLSSLLQEFPSFADSVPTPPKFEASRMLGWSPPSLKDLIHSIESGLLISMGSVLHALRCVEYCSYLAWHGRSSQNKKQSTRLVRVAFHLLLNMVPSIVSDLSKVPATENESLDPPSSATINHPTLLKCISVLQSPSPVPARGLANAGADDGIIAAVQLLSRMQPLALAIVEQLGCSSDLATKNVAFELASLLLFLLDPKSVQTSPSVASLLMACSLAQKTPSSPLFSAQPSLSSKVTPDRFLKWICSMDLGGKESSLVKQKFELTCTQHHRVASSSSMGVVEIPQVVPEAQLHPYVLSTRAEFVGTETEIPGYRCSKCRGRKGKATLRKGFESLLSTNQMLLLSLSNCCPLQSVPFQKNTRACVLDSVIRLHGVDFFLTGYIAHSGLIDDGGGKYFFVRREENGRFTTLNDTSSFQTNKAPGFLNQDDKTGRLDPVIACYVPSNLSLRKSRFPVQDAGLIVGSPESRSNSSIDFAVGSAFATETLSLAVNPSLLAKADHLPSSWQALGSHEQILVGLVGEETYLRILVTSSLGIEIAKLFASPVLEHIPALQAESSPQVRPAVRHFLKMQSLLFSINPTSAPDGKSFRRLMTIIESIRQFVELSSVSQWPNLRCAASFMLESLVPVFQTHFGTFCLEVRREHHQQVTNPENAPISARLSGEGASDGDMPQLRIVLDGGDLRPDFWDSADQMLRSLSPEIQQRFETLKKYMTSHQRACFVVGHWLDNFLPDKVPSLLSRAALEAGLTKYDALMGQMFSALRYQRIVALGGKFLCRRLLQLSTTQELVLSVTSVSEEANSIMSSNQLVSLGRLASFSSQATWLHGLLQLTTLSDHDRSFVQDCINSLPAMVRQVWVELSQLILIREECTLKSALHHSTSRELGFAKMALNPSHFDFTHDGDHLNQLPQSIFHLDSSAMKWLHPQVYSEIIASSFAPALIALLRSDEFSQLYNNAAMVAHKFRLTYDDLDRAFGRAEMKLMQGSDIVLRLQQQSMSGGQCTWSRVADLFLQFSNTASLWKRAHSDGLDCEELYESSVSLATKAWRLMFQHFDHFLMRVAMAVGVCEKEISQSHDDGRALRSKKRPRQRDALPILEYDAFDAATAAQQAALTPVTHEVYIQLEAYVSSHSQVDTLPKSLEGFQTLCNYYPALSLTSRRKYPLISVARFDSKLVELFDGDEEAKNYTLSTILTPLFSRLVPLFPEYQMSPVQSVEPDEVRQVARRWLPAQADHLQHCVASLDDVLTKLNECSYGSTVELLDDIMCIEQLSTLYDPFQIDFRVIRSWKLGHFFAEAINAHVQLVMSKWAPWCEDVQRWQSNDVPRCEIHKINVVSTRGAFVDLTIEPTRADASSPSKRMKKAEANEIATLVEAILEATSARSNWPQVEFAFSLQEFITLASNVPNALIIPRVLDDASITEAQVNESSSFLKQLTSITLSSPEISSFDQLLSTLPAQKSRKLFALAMLPVGVAVTHLSEFEPFSKTNIPGHLQKTVSSTISRKDQLRNHRTCNGQLIRSRFKSGNYNSAKEFLHHLQDMLIIAVGYDSPTAFSAYERFVRLRKVLRDTFIVLHNRCEYLARNKYFLDAPIFQQDAAPILRRPSSHPASERSTSNNGSHGAPPTTQLHNDEAANLPESREAIDLNALISSPRAAFTTMNRLGQKDLERLSVFDFKDFEDDSIRDAARLQMTEIQQQQGHLNLNAPCFSPITCESFRFTSAINQIDEVLATIQDDNRAGIVVSALFSRVFNDLSTQKDIIDFQQFRDPFLGNNSQKDWAHMCNLVVDSNLKHDWIASGPMYLKQIQNKFNAGQLIRAHQVAGAFQTILFACVTATPGAQLAIGEAKKMCVFILEWMTRRSLASLQVEQNGLSRLQNWISTSFSSATPPTPTMVSEGDKMEVDSVWTENAESVFDFLTHCDDPHALDGLATFAFGNDADLVKEEAVYQSDQAAKKLAAIKASASFSADTYVITESMLEIDHILDELLPKDSPKRGIVLCGLFCRMFKDLQADSMIKSQLFHHHFLGDMKRVPKVAAAWQTAARKLDNAELANSWMNSRPPYWSSVKSSLKGGRYLDVQSLVKDIQNVLLGIMKYAEHETRLHEVALKSCTFISSWMVSRCLSALQKGGEKTRLHEWICILGAN